MAKKVEITGIVRQSNSNLFYVTWTPKSPSKKITKKVYNTSKKKKSSTTKTRKEVTSGYIVDWYYAVDEGGKYYHDKNQTFGSGTHNSSGDLYTLPDNAASIKAVVTITADTYKSSASGTAKWFSDSSDSSVKKGMNLIPEAPAIGSNFAITGMNLSTEITFDATDNVDKIQVQGYINDGDTAVFDSGWVDIGGSYPALGYYPYTRALTAIGAYKIRARVNCPSSNNKGYKTPVSPWSAWSNTVDTMPVTPVLSLCEAASATSVKLGWSAVTGITEYSLEYVTDSADNFDLTEVTAVTVDNATSHIITGLTAGTVYYFQVRSVATISGGTVKSEHSNRMSAILATAPSAPTTWASTAVAIIASTLATTPTENLYFVHNSTDNSAMRTAKIRVKIGANTYYNLFTNPNTDSYGNLVDKTNSIDMWNLNLYNEEGVNTTLAGTLYSLFKAAGVSSFTWSVATKGIADAYSVWSVERVIKAYEQPVLALSVKDYADADLLNILHRFPIKLTGTTTPTIQVPISFYMSIIAQETYDDVNYKGESITVPNGAEILAKYLDVSTLDTEITAADANLKDGIAYKLYVIAYMDSGLKATAEYDFTTSWTDDMDSPDAEMDYNDKYRYMTIRPYCEYYLGADADNDSANNNVYYGTAITGTATTGTKFIGSGIANALLGDIYFNSATYAAYTCTVPGDAATAEWIYKTTFNLPTGVTWYSGTGVNNNTPGEPIPTSGVASANLTDHYFNTTTGDFFVCITAGAPAVAIWDYVGNCFWQMTPNTTLNVYRIDSNGSFVKIAEGIDNSVQNTDSAIYIRDPHPNFSAVTYRIVSINTLNGGTGHNDIIETVDEQSIIIQWNEKWVDNDNPFEDDFEGSILELPYNIKISDKNENDVTLAKYIGKERPVPYYGTQRGENPSFSCDFARTDTAKLALFRHLKAYQGSVYIREPSGLGYWAYIKPSDERSYDSALISVTLDITPVEGDA